MFGKYLIFYNVCVQLTIFDPTALKILHSVHPDDFKSYSTDKIRERFLVDNIVQPDKLTSVYTHYDRMIIGATCPMAKTIELENYHNLRADYFLERRELGIINVAGEGRVNIDGAFYDVNKLDCLYVGKGVKRVTFSSKNPESPAVFYLLSAPAHANHPTVLMTHAEAAKVHTGDTSTANKVWWDKAFAFLNDPKTDTLKPGKYIIDGDNVFAMITEGPTKQIDSVRWESHRNYIDLHYVIRGKEQIGAAPVSSATVTKPYDASHDAANYSVDGKYYPASPGEFFLFFPSDAHRPGIKAGGIDTDKKLVIKIRYTTLNP